MYKNMYFEEVSSRFMNGMTVETKDNVAIFEEAVENFKAESYDTVTAYKTFFGLKNNEDCWEDKKFVTYVRLHITEFEHFLVDICDTMGKLVSFKPHKNRINEIREVLTGNYGVNDYTYYSTSLGFGEDIINISKYSQIVELGLITEKGADFLDGKSLDQLVYLNKEYVKMANELLGILKENEITCIFTDARCYGFENCLK